MSDKSTTELWKNTFSETQWQHSEKIKEILSFIEIMDKIIAKHLKQTTVDFPFLTDHSLNHSDMLWKYSDIIIGDKEKYLNPAEGFILNSVFLLHDSGMCFSIVNDKVDIKSDPIYQDYVALNRGKIEEHELELEASFFTVRENHGDYAIRICKEPIKGDEYFIPELDYREEFSDMISKIAKSHTCNVNFIERELGGTYQSPKFPTEWSIDWQKLAFILRTADAAHLDNLRTPKSLKMIQEIKGVSREHWTFQKKLGMPRRDDDGLLVYTTNNPFNSNEQKAWWYCYSALKTLDNELKQASNYFVSKNLEGLSARGVKAIVDTLTLGEKYIRTKDWISIDTTVKVSNPVHIASKLGGEQLYGNKSAVIRELIQNSIDAIHLYRFQSKQNTVKVGKIIISIEKIGSKFYLIVVDNGIGMSQSLMTNELLDFGGSYWRSNRFSVDYKGMVAKGFDSIGKFGIGFFSIFMLGGRASVASWKFGESRDNMRTLDFYEGIYDNPILRNCNEIEKEKILDRGTAVFVELPNNPYEKEGIINNENFIECSLKSLVKNYILNVDVEIEIRELDGTNSIIAPNFLEHLSYPEMISWLTIKKNEYLGDVEQLISSLEIELTNIYDENGRLQGRLALIPPVNNFTISSVSAIMARGIKVKELSGLAGFIESNDVISIKRDIASKSVSYQSLKVWATKQIDIINKNSIQDIFESQFISLLVAFDFVDEHTPIALRKKDGNYTYVTINQLEEFIKVNNVVEFYVENHYSGIADCPGFINPHYGLPQFNDIIKQEDLEKLNSSDKIIKNLMIKHWKDFKQVTEHNKIPFSSDYLAINRYVRSEV